MAYETTSFQDMNRPYPTCAYCGSTLNLDIDKCPYCGGVLNQWLSVTESWSNGTRDTEITGGAIYVDWNEIRRG